MPRQDEVRNQTESDLACAAVRPVDLADLVACFDRNVSTVATILAQFAVAERALGDPIANKGRIGPVGLVVDLSNR
jgi:hypothetical protein